MPFTGSDICKVRIYDLRLLIDNTDGWSLARCRSCTSKYPSYRPKTCVPDQCPFLLNFSSFAIILPPVGVFLERGCNADFLINILLVSLFLLLNNRANAHQHFSTDHPGLHVRSPLHIQRRLSLLTIIPTVLELSTRCTLSSNTSRHHSDCTPCRFFLLLFPQSDISMTSRLPS